MRARQKMQIEDIKILKIEPDDIIVVRVDTVILGKQRDAMHEYLAGVLGKDVRVLILDGGVSIDVLNTKEAP